MMLVTYWLVCVESRSNHRRRRRLGQADEEKKKEARNNEHRFRKHKTLAHNIPALTPSSRARISSDSWAFCVCGELSSIRRATLSGLSTCCCGDGAAPGVRMEKRAEPTGDWSALIGVGDAEKTPWPVSSAAADHGMGWVAAGDTAGGTSAADDAVETPAL